LTATLLPVDVAVTRRLPGTLGSSGELGVVTMRPDDSDSEPEVRGTHVHGRPSSFSVIASKCTTPR
jgi:hypothetical protein